MLIMLGLMREATFSRALNRLSISSFIVAAMNETVDNC